MPRYVILEHDWPEPHFDLMLEDDDSLRTWRLESVPSPVQEVSATKSFAHRKVYLDYEGPVSRNRGSVQQWDQGSFRWECDEPGLIRVFVEGRRLRGVLELLGPERSVLSYSPARDEETGSPVGVSD
jgi:hypothetical protein